jgi:hypothetical protein
MHTAETMSQHEGLDDEGLDDDAVVKKHEELYEQMQAQDLVMMRTTEELLAKAQKMRSVLLSAPKQNDKSKVQKHSAMVSEAQHLVSNLEDQVRQQKANAAKRVAAPARATTASQEDNALQAAIAASLITAQVDLAKLATGFEVGARVIVCEIEAWEFLARLNGIFGTVVEQDLYKDSFRVRLDSKGLMWLPRKRLRPAGAATAGAATAARAHAVERVAEESQHVTEDKELEEYALHAAITASLITAQEAQAAASVESRQRQAAPGAASAPRPQRPPWKAGDRVRLVNVNRIIAHLNGETGIVTDTVLKADGRTSVRVKLDSEDPRSLRSSWYAADSLEPE